MSVLLFGKGNKKIVVGSAFIEISALEELCEVANFNLSSVVAFGRDEFDFYG